MDSSNSPFSGGHTIKPLTQSRESSPHVGGEADVVVDNSDSFAGRGRRGHGGCGDLSSRSISASFEAISLTDFPEGPLRDLIMRYNCLGYSIEEINTLMMNCQLTPAQAPTCGRTHVSFALEHFKRCEKFLETDVFHYIAGKLIRQLSVLGKVHNFTEQQLLFFVCQATANQTCIDMFKKRFMPVMSVMSDRSNCIFWLICWICVMTMSEAPYSPELYTHFFRWFEAMINGDESPEDVPESVASILEDMQARVQAAFEALPENPGSTREQIEEACADLCIEPPPLDEDGDVEPDNASDGGLSTNSSVFSVGGTRHNPMDRFVEGMQTITKMLQSRKSKHLLFSKMTDQQLERLIRGLLRRMTRRSKKNRTLRSFNRILCEKLLEIVNRHGSNYKLNLSEIVLKVIQATGILEIGLRLWELVSAETNNCETVKSALFAALIMMRIGNHTMLRNQTVVNQIFDSAFRCCDSEAPQSVDFPEHFAVILQSAIQSASQEVGEALDGRWQVPPYLSAAISKRSSMKPAPKHESARGGGAAAHPKKHAPKDNAVNEDLEALLREQKELKAKIAAAKKAGGRKM